MAKKKPKPVEEPKPAEEAKPVENKFDDCDKPHLSVSQMMMSAKCGEAYRRRYIEGEKIPPGVAAARGKAFHAGAEHNMRQKIESRVDLPANDIVDAAVAALDEEVSYGISLTPEEKSIGLKNVVGATRDTVAALALAHAEIQAPDFQPTLVEQKFRIPLPGKRDLVGVIDLADERHAVVDFKTAARSKPQSEADESIQLTAYASAYHQQFGESPLLVLDTLVTKTKGVERQWLESRRQAEDFRALANRIDAVSHAIDAGSFQPAPVGVWWCSAKWCGYHATCPFVNGKRTQND